MGDGVVGEHVILVKETEAGKGRRGGARKEGRQPHSEEEPHRSLSLSLSRWQLKWVGFLEPVF